MTSGTNRPIDWKGLFDGLLTVMSVVVLVLSLLSVVSGRGENVSVFAARFWQMWGGVLRTVARTAGQGALQAEAAYWSAIEKVRK